MKVINNIYGFDNLKIVEDKDFFCHGTDGLLLANYVKVNKKDNNLLDIGAGTGIISLILASKFDIMIDAVEIQYNLVELLKESIDKNNFSDKINLINADMNEYFCNKKANSYDIITVNPPYYNSGRKSRILEKEIARHEKFLTLETVFLSARKLLKNKGKLYIVYRADNLDKIFRYAENYNLAVKELSFVHTGGTASYGNAKLCLIMCCKNANPGLKILKPIIM